MLDDTQDVKPSDTSAEETQNEVQEVETAQTTSTEQTAQAEETTVKEVPNLDPNLYDPMGVPWKNRFYEKERKFTELVEKLPGMIEEKLSATKKETPKEYTISDLESYALQYPEKRPWVEEEKAKLITQQSVKLFSQQIEAREKSQRDEAAKRSAFEYVAKNYSEVVKKGPKGEYVGFDESHPLMQEIGALYSSSPELQARPDGLALAADIAYGRFARGQASKNAVQTKKVISDKKKLENKVLPEGAGRSEVSEPKTDAALDRLKKSGRAEDAQDAIGEILRAKGIFK